MRVLWVALVLLAGCTSGPGLNVYIMNPAEAPEGCRLLDITGGEGLDIARFTGLQTNPGRFNSTFFGEDEFQSVDNWAVLYACSDDPTNFSLFSGVQRFATVADADAWAAERIRCDASPTLQDGNILASIEPDGRWSPDWLEAAEQAAERIMRSTGAVDYCAGKA